MRVQEILGVGDKMVRANEGGYVVSVHFRIVAFKPFVGEVLEGALAESFEEGIRVSLGFFDHCYVSAEDLPQNSSYEVYEEEVDGNRDGGTGDGSGGEKSGGSGGGGSSLSSTTTTTTTTSSSSSTTTSSEIAPPERNWCWNVNGAKLWLFAGFRIRLKVDSVVFTPPQKKTPGMTTQPPQSAMMVYGKCNSAGLGRPEWWQSHGGHGNDRDGAPATKDKDDDEEDGEENDDIEPNDVIDNVE